MNATPRTILIVDDDRQILGLVEKMLRPQGVTVLSADKPSEALRICEAQPVDVLISDVMMPEMDGVELIRVLRKAHPRLKIIASSGLGTEKGGSFRAAELEALGVTSFLAKPYTVDKLLAALQDLLRNGKDACATHG